MSVTFDVDISRAVAYGPRMQRAVCAAVSDAVLQSSTPFVPYDTHELRKSGHVQTDREAGEVAWGSSDIRYARVQYLSLIHI